MMDRAPDGSVHLLGFLWIFINGLLKTYEPDHPAREAIAACLASLRVLLRGSREGCPARPIDDLAQSGTS